MLLRIMRINDTGYNMVKILHEIAVRSAVEAAVRQPIESQISHQGTRDLGFLGKLDRDD